MILWPRYEFSLGNMLDFEPLGRHVNIRRSGGHFAAMHRCTVGYPARLTRPKESTGSWDRGAFRAHIDRQACASYYLKRPRFAPGWTAPLARRRSLAWSSTSCNP
jgi:hypothetical protein